MRKIILTRIMISMICGDCSLPALSVSFLIVSLEIKHPDPHKWLNWSFRQAPVKRWRLARVFCQRSKISS